MKICTLQIALALTLSGLALAHDNYAQVLDQKITLTLKEVSIEEALQAIENLTNVKFFYSLDQLDIKDRISLEAIDRTLRDVLNQLLTPHYITYKVHDKKSTITLKKQDDKPQSIQGEKRESRDANPGEIITGKVTDAETLEPIAGVNVIVKGTTRGTSTDVDGRFTIDAHENETLVFSFIGFKTLEISVTAGSTIDVAMQAETSALKEIVINAGYWQVLDKERTGNIGRVEAKDIQKQPVQNPLAALQGRISG